MRTKKYWRYPHDRFRRRGAVAVQVAVMSTVILGFGALVIDLGNLYAARTELQRAADAAALAGASAYLSNGGLMGDDVQVAALAMERAQSFSYRNPTLGDGTILDATDVTLGTFDFNNPDNGLDTSGQAPFNAVQVVVRRAPGSSNGPVVYLFATIFGLFEGGVGACGTAAVDQRYMGYEVTEQSRALIPFTVHQQAYEDMLVNGSDNWSYDAGEIIQFSDGVPELHLYAWKLSGGGGGNNPDGAGNFGLLSVGIPSDSVPEIRQQILEGIAPEQLVDEIGTAEVTFYDEDGDPVTYEIDGTPGLSGGMEEAVLDRIGDVVAFFIHDDFWDTGTSTVYHIVDIRFGRLMHIDLHGSSKTRAIVVQPVAYTDPGVIVGEYGEYSYAGMVRLVR